MKKLPYAVLICVVVLGSSLAGFLFGQRGASQRNSLPIASSITAVRTLEADTTGDNDVSSFSPGTVKIGPERQQAIGVRTGVVEKKPESHTLRVLGRVASDETRIYRLNAAIDGWILKTYDNSAGSLVKKDELLATFYSPEFLGVVQAYLFSISAAERYQASGRETAQQINLTKTDVRQNENTLRNIGMSEFQIKEIARTRKYTEQIYITAPVTGFVMERNVSPGEQFNKGKELYRFVDLSRVWILADVFENEAYDLPPGTRVQVFQPFLKKRFEATVTNVLPLFDGASRTVKVRLEADNPGYFLRPDMFVDIELPIHLPSAVTVPGDAILDSGLRKTVFVERGNGFFEPREVETGRHIGDRIEITRGLDPGERIVISGTFLIDSESRMEMAASGMYENLDKDPVNGLSVSVKKAEKAGRKIGYKGKTYYFISEQSKEQFEKEPERYTKWKQSADSSRKERADRDEDANGKFSF